MEHLNIKLIAMDLDGTLLRDDKTIDDQTMDRLFRCQQQGIILVLATGRDKGGIDFVSEPLQLAKGNNYIAGVNGQIVYSFAKQEYWVDRMMDADDAHHVLAIAQKYDCEAVCCCGYDHYDFISKRQKLLKQMRSKIQGKPMDYGLNEGKRNFIPIDDATITITQDINKFILIQTPRFFKKYLGAIRKELIDYEILEVGPAWIEIMPKGVSKGNAILQIAMANGIDREDILCFGDAENDLSMMDVIPHGIAMGNAMEVVKQAAFAITDTNMNAGIAKALDRYVFHQNEQ